MLSKILPIYKMTSGCDYHRILLPLGYMGYDFSLVQDMTTEKLQSFKIITFNRTPGGVNPQALRVLKSKGAKIILDLDDYWYLYAGHYLNKHWVENKVPETIIQMIKIADVVTCTTERLASKIRFLNSNVVVIPNALPFINHGDQFTSTKTASSTTRFGFVGGTSHKGDLMSIAPVFQYFNQLNFSYCGFSPRSKEAIGIQTLCSNSGKNLNYKSVDMAPLDKYMYAYDNLDCCIAPLLPEEFNKYKSNLKVLEAGLKKCALICSPNECYTDTVPAEVVTYCKSVKDWKEAIKKHQDLDYTKNRGEKLHEWVKANYSLEEVNKQRLQLYESL